MRMLEHQRHRYTESGLENVYLDRIALLECESCGERAPVIPRIEELHATLARAIAIKPVPLSGPEIRFLRKQLRLSARQWAAVLHVDHATLSRWENGGQAPGGRSDILIRFAYFRNREEQTGVPEREPVSKFIAAVDLGRTTAAPYVLRNAEDPPAWLTAVG